MKVSIAVLTYNRLHMLKRTLASMERTGYPHTLDVVDGGSTDGVSWDFVRGMGGHVIEEGSTVGASMNVAIGLALAHTPDLVVFSADDYEYHPGWLQRLVAFWQGAPCDIKLVAANLEPAYAWNTVRAAVDSNGQRALVRATLPGSNWSFRAEDWPQIGPMEDKTGGEDLTVCKRLHAHGYRLAALDLSEHIGERESAWGNGSWQYARPLDKAAWGLP